MSRRSWLHLAFWLPLVLGALGYRWWLDRSQAVARGADEAVAASDAPWRQRRAEADEWARDIAGLGRVRAAKRLTWRALGPAQVQAGGALVWWHDGQNERVSYLPVAEDPPNAGLALVAALRDGRAVLFDLHGDAELVGRLEELGGGEGLPPDWEVLLPPEPATP
jgi:hypothetical protein